MNVDERVDLPAVEWQSVVVGAPSSLSWKYKRDTPKLLSAVCSQNTGIEFQFCNVIRNPEMSTKFMWKKKVYVWGHWRKMADELLIARGRTGLDKSRGATGNPPVGTRQFFPSCSFDSGVPAAPRRQLTAPFGGVLNGEEGGGGFFLKR